MNVSSEETVIDETITVETSPASLSVNVSENEAQPPACIKLLPWYDNYHEAMFYDKEMVEGIPIQEIPMQLPEVVPQQQANQDELRNEQNPAVVSDPVARSKLQGIRQEMKQVVTLLHKLLEKMN